MTLFVNTNVPSMMGQRRLFEANNALNVSFERLASGLRINRAADDSAGLAQLTRFNSQEQGLEQSVRNANDAISLTQSAEGALQETTRALQRIRQLAVQSQSGINSSSDRAALQQEVTALVAEISRVGSDTQFAGNDILDGTYSATFLIGANAGSTTSVNFSRTGGFGASGLGVGNLNITSVDNVSAAITSIDGAISAIGRERADIGALENRFQVMIRNLNNVKSNLASSKAIIEDADFAKETAELTRNQIIAQASTAILSQSNQQPQIALRLLP